MKTTLINHYKTHDKPGCECQYCDSSFTNPRIFNVHVRSVCFHYFFSKLLFTMLSRNHENDNSPNYICFLCEKVFSTLNEAKDHRSVHDGEIESTQNIIEPLLKQPLHQTTEGYLPLKPPNAKVPNTGTESPLERPHHCKICDARFTRLMSLKRHMLHHSGERKFRCNLCHK